MKKLILIILVAAVVVLGLVALVGYSTLYRERPMTDAQRETLTRIANLRAEYKMAGSLRADWFLATGTFTETEARKAAKRDSAVHILFLGVDRRKKERGRTDAIHLLRFEPGRLTLFSIPRDALVGIHGEPQKVNAAYAIGGAPLTIRTIEDLVKIRIDGHLEVDLARFADVAQLARTVTLDGKLIGAEEIFKHLDGMLSWLRNRSFSGGDLRRIQRQQIFIVRALDWTLTLYREHPNAFEAMVKPILNLLPTDITYAQVIALCENYTQSPVIGHAGWTPPALPARNPALAEIERFYLPGRCATLDSLTGEVIDSAAAVSELRHAAREAVAAGDTRVLTDTDPERYLSVYIADTQPLLNLLQAWRKKKLRANYEIIDTLPGEDTRGLPPASGDKPHAALAPAGVVRPASDSRPSSVPAAAAKDTAARPKNPLLYYQPARKMERDTPAGKG